MNKLKEIYKTSLSLLTDLYQITMAYGYWKQGKQDQEVVFHAYFRKNPFNGGFAIASGLESIIDYLEGLQFTKSDLEYLSQIKGNDEKPLFEDAFLDYLENLKFDLTIDAIPEGTVVFPNEPLIRVKGPIILAQLVETPILTIINFQTLIASKACRIKIAAKNDTIIEFGLRRAQGIDGGLSASRASYIGGCDATSNVLAGKLFEIPIKGTHAHSWVMSFESEVESFEAYASSLPNNTVLLVDTYDTIQGVRNAIQIGKQLKLEGYTLNGIRLDSGDLAYLSEEARKMLDEAGFEDCKIVASNDLDENIIASLKNQQGAKIDIWGVGTKLVSSYDQAALGGVYKLGALKKEGNWTHKIKLSEQLIKISNPGIQQVRRFYDQKNVMVADMIFDELNPPKKIFKIIDPMNEFRNKKISSFDENFEDLLIPIFKKGALIYKKPTLIEIKKRLKSELEKVHPSILRFSNPHQYPVGLEESLYIIKSELIKKLKK